MKLLFCEDCYDVFKLDPDELRSCKCGRVRGKYNSDCHTSVSNGKGRSLAIGNGSLMNALCGRKQFEYFSESRQARLTTFLAWSRPNDGPENERSTVDPDL